MGLFGKLFDKKNCCICGGEIGLLGNRKLEDGNLCKHCAAKLSPWFSERRHSTVAQIAQQLDDRQLNLQRVAMFQPTRSYGDHMKLIIDDRMNAFMVTSSTVSSLWQRENPDVFDYACVTGCTADIHEHRREVFRKGPDGHQEPFQPRRYLFEYDCRVTITLNHPWIDDISFTLANDIHGEDEAACNELIRMAEDVQETMTGVRPDLSHRIPRRLPFCRECGADLPAIGAPCRNCARLRDEAKLRGAIASTAFIPGQPGHGGPAPASPLRPNQGAQKPDAPLGGGIRPLGGAPAAPSRPSQGAQKPDAPLGGGIRPLGNAPVAPSRPQQTAQKQDTPLGGGIRPLGNASTAPSRPSQAAQKQDAPLGGGTRPMSSSSAAPTQAPGARSRTITPNSAPQQQSRQSAPQQKPAQQQRSSQEANQDAPMRNAIPRKPELKPGDLPGRKNFRP